MAAIASFLGGTATIVLLTFLAIPLARFALRFGSPEFFALICLSMTLLTFLSRKSFSKGVLMILFGLLVGGVGIDSVAGVPRFTFGTTFLLNGAGVVPVIMGVFGISEIIETLAQPEGDRAILKEKIKNILPNLDEWRKSAWPMTRGSIIGFLTGILPGGSAVMATFFAYTVEKKVSKHPERFGSGVIEGVAAPEAANNAAVTGALVPLLSLGLPANVVMAVLLGALMIHGIAPGPLFIVKNPDIFWAFIACMYMGNIMLLALNLPLVGLWVSVLKIPSRILMPIIVICCLVGAYANNNSIHEIGIMGFFGILGYYCRKFDYELAPMVMAFILGPMWESSLRESLIMSDGSLGIFVQRPISAILISTAAALIVLTLFSNSSRAKRKKISQQVGEGE
jgi:putative tricarboxylic transport membrane protein